MPNRPLTPCRHAGCSALVERPAVYCPKHQIDKGELVRDKFRRLDERKTKEQREFYASWRWAKTSKAHREIEPLCRRCRARGMIVPARLVHHNPSVEELKVRGLDPYDHQYLESLCLRCHNEEELWGRKARDEIVPADVTDFNIFFNRFVY